MAAKGGGGGGVGTLKSTSINGVKLYSVTGKNYVAPWVLAKKKRSLRKDAGKPPPPDFRNPPLEYQRRLELIHDLRFETATTRIKVTPDGQYVIASGIYPPQMKVFELKELSMKFERHMISEIIDFEVLGDDYSKLAFLCADRSVCLHAKYGSHYSVRIPRMGRDLAYDCWSCDLLCAASSSDLYRINLEQGRFLASLSSQSPAINVVTRSMIHGLVACGGEDGAVECFDMRRKSSVGRINTASSSEDVDQEVTSLQFDENQGYLLAVGSSIGKVSIYDIRMSSPLRVKDHMYGSPILNIKWHQTLNSSEPKLITADKHIVRVWDPNTGNNMTSIEPDNGSINDVCIFPNSGLMLLALDNSQIPAHFIPALGPAPKWCSHLDNLTEEMEEKQENTLYDDYKFLTEEEMERLGLSEYKNSDAVRAHLHGYVIRYDLYKKQRAKLHIADYETLQNDMKAKKLADLRKSRITQVVKIPKANRQLLDDIRTAEEEIDADVENASKSSIRKKKMKLDMKKALLTDPRFQKMFENKDYEIDVNSREYQAIHPQLATKEPHLIEEHFESVSEDEEEQDADSSDASAESDSDNDTHNSKRIRNMLMRKSYRLYEVKDGRHAEAFLNSVSLGNEEAVPIGDRVAALERKQNSRALDKVKYGPGGSREISFNPRSSRRRTEEDEHSEEEQKDYKRRSVQSLGLKQNKAEFYLFGGRGGRGGGGGRGRGGGGGILDGFLMRRTMAQNYPVLCLAWLHVNFQREKMAC
ncbi:Nucleolar protein 10 [Triticum urartu]|uniref:Nucleolar protein 10 n=1 Tax=Triticum urartu TaxID=4572 RepID=M7ZJ42_TRIUA|nr:Nucleolar protein 10 [Triticum urartu]